MLDPSRMSLPPSGEIYLFATAIKVVERSDDARGLEQSVGAVLELDSPFANFDTPQLVRPTQHEFPFLDTDCNLPGMLAQDQGFSIRRRRLSGMGGEYGRLLDGEGERAVLLLSQACKKDPLVPSRVR